MYEIFGQHQITDEAAQLFILTAVPKACTPEQAEKALLLSIKRGAQVPLPFQVREVCREVMAEALA